MTDYIFIERMCYEGIITELKHMVKFKGAPVIRRNIRNQI